MFPILLDIDPVSINNPGSIITTKNRSVDLTCVSSGNPSITYKWYKNDIYLTDRSGLQINNPTFEDAGEYKCYVENSVGKQVATTTLEFKCKFRLVLKNYIVNISCDLQLVALQFAPFSN